MRAHRRSFLYGRKLCRGFVKILFPAVKRRNGKCYVRRLNLRGFAGDILAENKP